MDVEVNDELRSLLHIQGLQGEAGLPLLIRLESETQTQSWQAHLPQIQSLAQDRLYTAGALLLRGFDIYGEHAFQQFARSFGHELLNYEFGSTPRSALEKGVFTSTEYPAHQSIPLHNEQSYTLQWPMKIWFHCMQPSEIGGETPIADSREIFRRIDPKIKERFENKRLMYVRNYGNGLDLPWQKAFNTDDPGQAERFCRAQQIDFEWKDDGELRTRQICQATARHPQTGETVWFNQAHLFHVSNLGVDLRETLLAVVEDEIDLPRNVYYGDGTPLEDSVLDEIRGVLDECTVTFPWQKGDVLMLDNMLVAHGRAKFTGPRKVIVAMAEPASI